jgi:hypothetical protein
MPKTMPAEVEREMQKVLGFLSRPSPIEVCHELNPVQFHQIRPTLE